MPVILLLWAAILALHWQTAASMVAIWNSSDTFAHCALVLPISIWMIWRRRGALAAAPSQLQPWLLVPLLGVSVLWLLGDVATVNAASHFALTAMLVLVVPAVLGVGTAKVVLFPLLFLFFAVPFGEFMIEPMMDWTADFVVLGLQLTGIPVYREGLLFVIPTGTWSVIDECSGVRYLIASFMVGTLFAYLNYRSYKRRAIFMVMALLIPIVANWLRAYIIVMMGHLSNNKLATGVDHLLYGWIFFGVVVFIMFAIGARWSEPDLEATSGNAGSAALQAASGAGWYSTPLVAVGAALALVFAPLAYTWALERAEAAAAAVQLELPSTFGAWSASGDRSSDWLPRYLNPSIVANKIYAGPNGKVGVYIAYYRHQDAGRKLVSATNGLLHVNDRNRLLRNAATVDLPIGTLRTAEVVGRDVGGSATRQHTLTWSAHWIDGRFLAGDRQAKLAGMLQRLRGRGDDGAAVVLYADERDVESSRAALAKFAAENMPLIDGLLRRAHDAR